MDFQEYVGQKFQQKLMFVERANEMLTDERHAEWVEKGWLSKKERVFKPTHVKTWVYAVEWSRFNGGGMVLVCKDTELTAVIQ